MSVLTDGPGSNGDQFHGDPALATALREHVDVLATAGTSLKTPLEQVVLHLATTEQPRTRGWLLLMTVLTHAHSITQPGVV
jgi:hypothetical protein